MRISIQFGEQENECIASITEGKSNFDLHWTDGIGSWLEEYEDLSTALARLAVLAHCSESAWELHFTHTAQEFTREFCKFARKETH